MSDIQFERFIPDQTRQKPWKQPLPLTEDNLTHLRVLSVTFSQEIRCELHDQENKAVL
jgi:hypothetical protein